VGKTRIKTKPSDNQGLSKIRAVAPAEELLDVIAGEKREGGQRAAAAGKIGRGMEGRDSHLFME